ncbi:MAG: glycosyltransferase [Eubacteriales bacterium]|nr:glycosyltransferase [Eubacteriales bacterium]
MNADPFLTIIVPVYGIREEYLRQCIESLLAQEREDFRVLLIDDGSPDRCGVICDEYAEKDSRLTVIHQENQGVSAARNNCLRVTDTEWVAFVDADDWVERDYVTALYGELNGSARDADVLLLDYTRELRNSSEVRILEMPEGEVSGENLEAVRKSTYYKLQLRGRDSAYDMVVLWNKVYSRRFLRELDVWFVPEARKGQDRLFNADVLLGARRIRYLHRSLYHYRCLEESRTNRYDPDVPALTRIELKSLRRIVRRHGLEEQTREYLRYRISTRLYACMRLYCFHENNPAPRREKLRQAARLAASKPFADAVRSVDLRLLNRQERLFVRCVRKKQFGLLYLLVRVKSIATGRRLSR